MLSLLWCYGGEAPGSVLMACVIPEVDSWRMLIGFERPYSDRISPSAGLSGAGGGEWRIRVRQLIAVVRACGVMVKAVQLLFLKREQILGLDAPVVDVLSFNRRRVKTERATG